MELKKILYIVACGLFYLFLVWLCISALGCAGVGPNVPSVIINKYSYVLPAPTPPGASPEIADLNPPIDYQTVFGSSFDDPTLTVFNNKSYRKVKIIIDGKPPIALAAYQASADLHLGVGEHRAKIIIQKPTQAHGTLEVIRDLVIFVRPESRSQIFYIFDY